MIQEKINIKEFLKPDKKRVLIMSLFILIYGLSLSLTISFSYLLWNFMTNGAILVIMFVLGYILSCSYARYWTKFEKKP